MGIVYRIVKLVGRSGTNALLLVGARVDWRRPVDFRLFYIFIRGTQWLSWSVACYMRTTSAAAGKHKRRAAAGEEQPIIRFFLLLGPRFVAGARFVGCAALLAGSLANLLQCIQRYLASLRGEMLEACLHISS